MPSNFLHATPNPWNLAAPPQWFLDEMYAMDAELVIFRSAEEPCYRFARKAKVHPAVMHALKNRPDTKTYWEHRLVPVTSLPQFEQWSPRILIQLAERDIQRVGGAQEAANILDAHDERVEARLQAETADGADLRAIDMYREHKSATGQRVFLGGKKSEGGRTRAEVPRRAVARPTHWGGSGNVVFTP